MANGSGGGGYTPLTSGGAPSDPFSNPLGANKAPNTAAKTDFTVVTKHNNPAPPPNGHDPFVGDLGERTSASDAMDTLTSLTGQQMMQLQDKLIAAGYLASTKRTGTDDDATRTAYYQLLQDTGNYNSAGVSVTPDELLARRTAALGTAPDGAGGARHAGTTTSTSVNLSDPLTAQALIDKILTERLGRHPTAQQKADFTAALQSAQQANPNTTTTRDNPVGQYDTSQTSASSGGIDPAQFADNYTTQHFGTEANTYQAATSLYDTALQVLGIGGR